MPASTDARFSDLVRLFHAERFRLAPTWATALGHHEHDALIEDYTLAGAQAEREVLARWRAVLAASEFDTLSRDHRLDRTWLLAVIDGALMTHDVLRPLERDPDRYSSGITESAFVLINRDFAPAEARLTSLLARMARMPHVLELGRRNLHHPPRVRTQIALEQIEGHRTFFRESVPEAFAGVRDADLRSALATACAAVDTALADYGDYLSRELLPRSDGDFVLGAEALARKLYADELLELPIDTLLAVGEADLARNQAAMRAAAAAIAPDRPLEAVLADLGASHVAVEDLLETTRGLLASVLAFCRDRALLTVPAGPMPEVVETPSFLRATCSAAMDTPGPFETHGLAGYFYVTRPNPAWPEAEQEAYMQQWTPPLLANLVVHEAYPGHYVQFLLAKAYPTETRRILWSPSNAEGWAHYCEAMVLDEGFGDGDPRARVAQLQDALLRNARLVVGLRLHTGRMSLAEAQAFFEREAYLAAPVARSEAWRGATDPTYGYYTLGKLMLLKLRDDLQAARGDAFRLKDFHDEFLRLGPLPLPLVREALLGERGTVL